jgi:hypothetical protein
MVISNTDRRIVFLVIGIEIYPIRLKKERSYKKVGFWDEELIG